MKLYATTSSERASKGQGGNKYLRTVFLAHFADGSNRELFHVYIEPSKDGYRVEITTRHGETLYQDTFEDDTVVKGFCPQCGLKTANGYAVDAFNPCTYCK